MPNQLPMLTLAGRVSHVFLNPQSVDRKSGEVREAKYKVQLLCEVPLQNGEVRMDLQTVTTDHERVFQDAMGKQVRLPVGVFSTGKTVLFYALKGVLPEVLE